MNETKYYFIDCDAGKCLFVSFDLMDTERCFIELRFTLGDIANLMNMDVYGKDKMELEGVSGNCVRSSGVLEQQTISFNFKNANRGYRTISYNYKKLKTMMTEAFDAVCRSGDTTGF